LDPSAGQTTLAGLPLQDCGVKAVRIGPRGGEVITLPGYQPQPNERRRERHIQLHPNGSATITIVDHLIGKAARNLSEERKKTPGEVLRKQMENSCRAAGCKFVEFHTEGTATNTTDRLVYITPRMGTRTSQGLVIPIATQQQMSERLAAPRRAAFRFTASDLEENNFDLTIPEGSAFKSVPANFDITEPFIEVHQKFQTDGRTLRVNTNLRTLAAQLPASEAARVRSVYTRLQEHDNYGILIGLPAETR
jgi:hypothetical protein